jgi:hypothetical protein
LRIKAILLFQNKNPSFYAGRAEVCIVPFFNYPRKHGSHPKVHRNWKKLGITCMQVTSKEWRPP